MGFNKKGLLKFSVLTLLFLGLLAAWLGFGERGLVHLYRMEQERQDHMERINRLEDENRKLFEEINRMRDDQDYIESVARRELGLIKDDELLFRFVKDRKKHPSTHAGEEHKE